MAVKQMSIDRIKIFFIARVNLDLGNSDEESGILIASQVKAAGRVVATSFLPEVTPGWRSVTTSGKNAAVFGSVQCWFQKLRD